MAKTELIKALKSEEPLDKYIVFMYGVLDYSKSAIAETLNISRQSVYNALERHKELLKAHGIVMSQDN